MPKVKIEISPLMFSKIIDWTSINTEREVGSSNKHSLRIG